MQPMQRVISSSEEQAVLEFFNATADQLGVPRPLDAAGWRQVKQHLRAQLAQMDAAARISEDEHAQSPRPPHLLVLACSNLEIDMVEPRTGVSGALVSAVGWLTSPADRHSALSEVFRVVALVCLSILLGGVALAIAYAARGLPTPANVAYDLFCVSFLCMIPVSIFISSDTLVGAMGVLFFLTGISLLVASLPVVSVFARYVCAAVSLFGGAGMVHLWWGTLRGR
jgi:hypothetical protein